MAEELKEEIQEGVHLKTITPEALKDAIDHHDLPCLKEIVLKVPDIDIAEALSELDIKDTIRLFRDIDTAHAATLFDELSQEQKEELIKAMTDKELVSIVNQQSADDMADTVGDMPANLAKRVLQAADKDMRQDINTLLKFKPESAGAIMTTEFIEFREGKTVEEAIKEIREKGKDAETIYTIFVTDKKRKFVGTVGLDKLVLAQPENALKDLLDIDVPSVHVNTDQEEVANLFRRYDLNAMGVVNDDSCLVGIVTVDDAVDVMTQETSEDIEQMNAVSKLEDSYLETHPRLMAKKCVPWLIVLLILGTFSSLVLSTFQEQIGVLPVLAAFIPVLMDTGGNAGGQTIALMIRGLALREFKPRDIGAILWREMRSALLIGLCVTLFSFVWFTIEQYTGIVHNTQADFVNGTEWATIWNGECWSLAFAGEVFKVSAIVSVTLFFSVLVSKVIAIVLPLGVAALKKDPAIISQPLLTTLVDMASLLIYFGIAEVLILQFV